MISYLENIGRILYPARTVLPTSDSVEYMALQQLADIAERFRDRSHRPSFLDLWCHAAGEGRRHPTRPEEIELRRETHERPPVLVLSHCSRSVAFVPLRIEDALEPRTVRTVLDNETRERRTSTLVAIFPNRHSEIARRAISYHNARFSAYEDRRWIATDWVEIGGVVAQLAEIHHAPVFLEWATFLAHDFRVPWPILFAESHGTVTIADVLSDTVDGALFGLPEGLIPLLAGSATDLLAMRVSRLPASHCRPSRHAIESTLLQRIVEGQLNGRWSDVPWDTLAGTWPRVIAERIVAGSEPHYDLVGVERSDAPWDPVQIAPQSR